MEKKKTVLALNAHPDDAEFMCAGTLTMLHDKGWEIHIATMTPGDCGSAEHSREEISRIRRAEAAKSAKILDGTYHCLECDDVFIMYDRETLLKAVKQCAVQVKQHCAQTETHFGPWHHRVTVRLAMGGVLIIDSATEPRL